MKVRSKNVKAKIQPTADFTRQGKKHTKGKHIIDIDI